jgi:predicted alpha/beta-hydrolase family hydrolase
LRDPEELKIDLEAGAVTALVYETEPPRVGATFVLAHGAGAGQRSLFMVGFARALAALGIDVLTFDFPYMERRRRIPDARPVLEACYARVIARAITAIPTASEHLFIGGKSMGGRIATHVAAADRQLPIAGVILLGYPLHPPGRPDQRRDAHLKDVARPMLFVQGTRDSFGTPGELTPILDGLQPPPTLHVVDGGDHSLKVRAGKPAQGAVEDGVRQTVAEWIRAVSAAPSGTRRPRG